MKKLFDSGELRKGESKNPAQLKRTTKFYCQDYVEISQASRARMARGGWALLTWVYREYCQKKQFRRYLDLFFGRRGREINIS